MLWIESGVATLKIFCDNSGDKAMSWRYCDIAIVMS